jgi:hypothetical protein
VTTKRVKIGSDFKGGITAYGKVEKDLLRLLGDTRAYAVTTLIDYYGLPDDFPGMATRPAASSIVKAIHVETEWKKKVDHPCFHPYLMVHEFEALLFAKPLELSKALYNLKSAASLEAIRAKVKTPEEINDNPSTAPSQRIKNILPGYQKTLHGPMVSKRIGLPLLRSECPHFNDWLSWLEHL